MKPALVFLHLIVIISLAAPADALERRKRRPYVGRNAASFFVGLSEPVGQFGRASSCAAECCCPAAGNHDTPGVHWKFELEHFVRPGVSLGFAYDRGTYDDITYGGTLKTHVVTYGGFWRYVSTLRQTFHPFVKAGIGAIRVDFDSSTEYVRSDYSTNFRLGAGCIVLLHQRWGANGQIEYNFGGTENAYVSGTGTNVGFDVEYWTALVGITLFLP